jgi:hypothetical protein
MSSLNPDRKLDVMKCTEILEAQDRRRGVGAE